MDNTINRFRLPVLVMTVLKRTDLFNVIMQRPKGERICGGPFTMQSQRQCVNMTDLLPVFSFHDRIIALPFKKGHRKNLLALKG